MPAGIRQTRCSKTTIFPRDRRVCNSMSCKSRSEMQLYDAPQSCASRTGGLAANAAPPYFLAGSR